MHAPEPNWRFSTLLAAPHRLSFFTAASVMAVAALWWWVELMARAGWWPTSATAVPATFIHATVMSLGFLPLFFSGFLFTAGPKWLQMPDVAARTILPGVSTAAVGWALVLCGSHLHLLMSALGAMLAAFGWGLLVRRFYSLLQQSKARDKLHASLIAGVCALGVLAMLAAALGLGLGDFGIIRLAVHLGLWLFIVPVYVVVAHRMIPFFTASALPVLDAWRPNWLLWTLLSLVGLQGFWVVSDALGVQGVILSSLRAFSSLAGGVMVLGLAIRWGLVQSLRIRLLAMLHLGFVWLGVTLCLDTLAQLVGDGLWSHLPLHALTMGFLGSILLAMATRVSCGHSGRTLTADNLAWGLFWGLQVAAVLRLLAVVWPEQSSWLLLAGATVWLAVMAGWALRYGRWYGLPRVDGRPG